MLARMRFIESDAHISIILCLEEVKLSSRTYKVNFRFYVFIILIICIIGGLCFWIFSPAESYIRYGSMSSSGLCDAVIIYDEQLINIPENDRLIYQAAEGELVNQGQTVASLYKKGYVVSAVRDLWELQKNITAAQESETIKDIYKPELVQYDLDIEKTLKNIQDYEEGDLSYFELNSELIRLMSERQQYIRDNFSPSESVSSLYADEQERIAALSGWQEEVLAPSGGYLSWFTDGLESSLNASELSGITSSLIKQSLSKYTQINNRREGEVAKIVSAEKFYVAALCEDESLSVGSEAEIYISGVDEAFNAQVYDVINDRDRAVIFEISGEVERVLGMRSIQISVNSPINEGFIVHSGFIRDDGSGPYLYVLNDSGQKTAVYVNKLAENDNSTLVSARDGDLLLNSTIYNK